MSSLVLCDKALVALDDGSRGILNLPFTDITESLTPDWCLLCSFRGCPTVDPVFCELLDKWCFDLGGLNYDVVSTSGN